MSFADELARRRAEVAAEAAGAEADNDTPPFFGLRPRFTAVRPELIDGGGPWFVELVAELVRHPEVFTNACLARRLDDGTYECVGNDTWERLLREPTRARDRKEKKAAQARVQRIWQCVKNGDLTEMDYCRIVSYGPTFGILANGLVESTAMLTIDDDEDWDIDQAELQADIQREAIELIVEAESAG